MMLEHSRTAFVLLVGVLIGACLATLLQVPSCGNLDIEPTDHPRRMQKGAAGGYSQGDDGKLLLTWRSNGSSVPETGVDSGWSLVGQGGLDLLAGWRWGSNQTSNFTVTGEMSVSSINTRSSSSSTESGSRQQVFIAKEDSWLDKHFKSAFWFIPNCTYKEQPLHCEYVSMVRGKNNKTAQALLSQASAVLHPRNWNKTQLADNLQKVPQVWLNMESYLTTYEVFTAHDAELEMTYQTCSQVHFPYLSTYGGDEHGVFPTAQQRLDLLQSTNVPFPEKRNAVFWASSNCFPRNNRVLRVMELQKALANTSLALHSYGKCLRNMNETERAGLWGHSGTSGKTSISSKYKFCVAMENTNTRDYVTEKVYDALLAGCIPIYWGAPNAEQYLPHKKSVLNLDDFNTIEDLVKVMEQLANNQTAYEEWTAWKELPLDQLNPDFQRLLQAEHPMCTLCKRVVEYHESPQQFVKCRDNTTFWASTNSLAV